MEVYKFTAILKKEPGTKATYNVSIPTLPGCLTFGESLEEAYFNAQEALELYIETLLYDKKPVPIETEEQLKIPKKALTKKFYVSVEHKVTAGIPVYAETAKSHRR